MQRFDRIGVCHGGAAPGDEQRRAWMLPNCPPRRWRRAGLIYFERCAGLPRRAAQGATGKNLEPHWAKTAGRYQARGGGTPRRSSYGTEAAWSTTTTSTKEKTSVARYIRTPDKSRQVLAQGHEGQLEASRSGRPASDQADEQGQPRRTCSRSPCATRGKLA